MASMLISKGVDIVSTAAYIGDVPATVSNHYAHLITDAKKRAFDEMNMLVFNG